MKNNREKSGMDKDRHIYYLPGRDKSIHDRVGQAAAGFGFNILGLDLLDGFIDLRIGQQIELIQSDLYRYFHDSGAMIIPRSYGAFLLLQAMLDLPPFPGKILLLSPVLGATKVRPESGIMVFRPPRANRLLGAATNGTFPTPHNMVIYSGSED